MSRGWRGVFVSIALCAILTDAFRLKPGLFSKHHSKPRGLLWFPLSRPKALTPNNAQAFFSKDVVELHDAWPHKLQSLPYLPDALEPIISKETMMYHYGKHHATYVRNLNDLAAQEPWGREPLSELIADARTPKKMYNNAAQVYNHDFYWKSMSPDGGGEPKKWLKDLIDEEFGSYTNFKEEFKRIATSHFGSGWVWLVKNEKCVGRHDIQAGVKIIATHDAHIPSKDGFFPLLVLDIWEHAYYIDHRNARGKFVEDFFKLVNWRFAEDNLMALRMEGRVDPRKHWDEAIDQTSNERNYTTLFEQGYA
eukprot:GHVN01053900.1.p1 GENE.GHVN01053900.1~~GHVN01053900.1.p1  ORF type:complete len:308 (-),score=23.18 GHVN01053900.1:1421-2344(-)